MQSFGNVEAIQQDSCVDFGGVAALVANNSLEFTQSHAIVVRQRLGIFDVKSLALLQGCPKCRIAHDYCIDDAVTVESELILPQDTYLPGAGNGSFLRLNFSGQNLHER